MFPTNLLTFLGAPLIDPFESDYELISTTVLTGNTADISFTSIPSNYQHLQMRLTTRNTENAQGDGADLRIQFNSDTGSNYAHHSLRGNGTNVAGVTAASTAFIRLSLTIRDGRTANVFSGGIIDILDYTSTSKNTTVRSLDGYSVSGAGQIFLGSGFYNDTDAVTSIKVLTDANSFKTGSRFSLYGIR